MDICDLLCKLNIQDEVGFSSSSTSDHANSIWRKKPGSNAVPTPADPYDAPMSENSFQVRISSFAIFIDLQTCNDPLSVGRCIRPLKIKLTLQQRRSMRMRIYSSCPTTVRQLCDHRRRISRDNLHTSRNTICIPRGTPPMCTRL